MGAGRGAWADGLNFLDNASVFKNAVGRVSGLNRHSYGERAPTNRAVPNLVATFSLSNQGATVGQQDIPQLRVKTAAHALHGNAQVRSSILYMSKLDPAVDIKSNAVFQGNFRRNLPEPRRQSLVAWCFGGNTEFVAGCNPHAAHGIKNHIRNEGRSPVKVGTKDIAHARIIAPLAQAGA